MTDPTRWCDDDDASHLERSLLLAGQDDRLPASERRALWASIERALPAAPASKGKISSLGAKFAKAALLVAALGGIALAAQRATRSSESSRPSPAATPVAPPSAPSVVTSVGAGPEPVDAQPSDTAPVDTAPSDTRPAPIEPRRAAASQLLEESAALLEARAALRSGDASRALTLLEQARRKFPRGGLGQEREALTIEALARTGQSAKARLRAEKFLHAYPQSPYAADVRRVSGS